MSTTDDTAPAAEIERAEPLSTMTEEAHAPHVEVGSEAPAAEAAPAAAAATPAPAAETVDPASKPAPEQPFWYRKEIEKERKARQAAEARAEAAERRPAPQQRQDAQPEEDPDRPLTRREVEAIRQHDALVGRLERSEERFVDKLGEESFEKTREWLATRPDIEEWALKQRDPWAAAHSQYRKEELAAEIGEDPNAWREKERERLRQEILAEQQPAPQPGPAAAPQMRSAPPAPASTARSAAPRDTAGRFAGPRPIGELSKHKFS